MSFSATEPLGKTRIHVKPVVEYAAVAATANTYQQARRTWRVDGEVIGVPVGLIHIGSAIMCRDGKAGWLSGIAYHPQRGYPTHLIVRLGRLRPRLFRVAFNWVTAITPDRIVLSLWKHDLVQQPEYRSDDEIAEAVESVFHGAETFHEHADYLAIRATVEDGVVFLHGNVRDSIRRLEAERIVSKLRGVIGVQNFLFGDDEIAWKAEWILQRDTRLQIHNLRVESCLGLVRLHGWVGSLSQRALATTVVKRVPGVYAVNNGLVVEFDLESRSEAVQIGSWQPVEDAVVV